MNAGPPPSVSFVIPCLNEEDTLGSVLAKINRIRVTDLSDRATEIVVADNGSSDNSVTIAAEHGARVVHCAEPGYGAALRCGIEQARLDAVVFADADDTYDLLEAVSLVAELDRGFDLVIGSRLKGRIFPGAMPTLHRRVGTPVLNFLINTLHGRGGTRVSDCNSGFRCFRREAFEGWDVEGSGMEFASEMLLKALRSGARITEVPISLYPDRRARRPHLRTWRDGMRHLLQVFLQAPAFFHHSGVFVFLAGWSILFTGWAVGPTQIGPVSIFGIHSMLFALLGTIFGLTLWSTGLVLAVRVASDQRTYEWVLELGEGRLFWLAAFVGAVGVGLFAAIVSHWARNGFDTLALERPTIVLIAFASDGVLFVFNVITAHMMRQLKR